MTCREKLALEHPDWSEDELAYALYNDCPSMYRYLPDPNCQNISCPKCWDREIPESETIENKEEVKEMETNTTKKTKTELLNAIADLKKEVEKQDKYRQYEQVADELAAMRDALTDKGFTREEAMQFIFNAQKSIRM